MNSLVLLVLGMILLNSIAQLIPMFYPDLDPGLYLPYQFWINILLIFNWLLPTRKGLYLFKKEKENVVDESVVNKQVDVSSNSGKDSQSPSVATNIE